MGESAVLAWIVNTASSQSAIRQITRRHVNGFGLFRGEIVDSLRPQSRCHAVQLPISSVAEA